MSKLFELLNTLISKLNLSVKMESQELTDEQKSQVRDNIGAASVDDIGGASSWDELEDKPFEDKRSITHFSQTDTPNPPSYEVAAFGVTFYKISDLTPTREELVKSTKVVRNSTETDTFSMEYMYIDTEDAIMHGGKYTYSVVYNAGSILCEFQGVQLSLDVPETGMYIAYENGMIPNGATIDVYVGDIKTLDVKYLPENMALGYETKPFEDIVWDGNTDGLPTVSTEFEMEGVPVIYMYCKVSDTVLSKNNCIESEVVSEYSGDGTDTDTDTISEGEIHDVGANGSFYLTDNMLVLITAQANETINFDELMGLGGEHVFPEAGVWFLSGYMGGERAVYAQKLASPSNIKQIDKKFIPDVLPEVYDSDNGKFLCVENGAWVAKTVSEWSSGGAY